MSETNYADMLPLKPPQGIFDMAERYWKDTNVIVMNVEWITDPLTGLKHREVHCRCTACGEDFYCDYTSSGYCSHSSAQYGFFNYRTNEHIVDALTVVFDEGEANKVNEYLFSFVSGETATVLTLPSSVKWVNELTVEANKRYEISVVDNVALWCAVDYEVVE